MNLEDLRLIRLVGQAMVLPDVTQPVSPIHPIAPGLSSTLIGKVYAKMAGYGFTGVEQVPSGAQLTMSDRLAAFTFTAQGWAYTEDLDRSAFQVALERMGMAVSEFMAALGPRSFAGHAIQLQALWSNIEVGSDNYVSDRFASDPGRELSEQFSLRSGLDFNGIGVRVSLLGDAEPAAAEFANLGLVTKNAFDVRVEPFFVDKTKLFLQIDAQYPVPTSDVSKVEERTRFVYELLMGRVAPLLTRPAEDRGDA